MCDYTLSTIYSEAVQRFPFPDLKRSGRAEGTLDEFPTDEGNFFSESFTFITGYHSRPRIHAQAHFECTLENQQIIITALCWLSVKSWWLRKTDFRTYIWCEYDLEQKQWRLALNTFERMKGSLKVSV